MDGVVEFFFQNKVCLASLQILLIDPFEVFGLNILVFMAIFAYICYVIYFFLQKIIIV